jgi:hypothetical protein
MSQAHSFSAGQPPRRKQAMTQALVPSGIQALPIEPPDPSEVADRLTFKNAVSYQAAIALAQGYRRQARLAVERRMASIRKGERLTHAESQETQLTHDRQMAQAHLRYKALIEQAHGKHRQILHQARLRAYRAEEQYKKALSFFPEYGACELKRLALQDAHLVFMSIQEAYQGVLGPDGLGELGEFLARLDKSIDLARERRAIAPLQFIETLITGVLHRQVLKLGRDQQAVERLKQVAGTRLLVLQGLLAQTPEDTTPEEARAIYQSVRAWLAQAAGTPFGLALERIKRDMAAFIRQEQEVLETAGQSAARRCENLQQLGPALEAYAEARRLLHGTEQAARSALQHELAKIDARLEKERHLIEALVIGLDHTAAKRLEEARRSHQTARKLVTRWGKELRRLEALTGFQKFMFKQFEGFDAERFWKNFHLRDGQLE